MRNFLKSPWLRAAVFFIFICFLFAPAFGMVRSLSVMVPYSIWHHRQSVLHEMGISISIKAPKLFERSEWYPTMIYFTADRGLSSFVGEQVRFTVLYNFGSFDRLTGSSFYYDPSSPVYGAFYGGYIIRPKDEQTRFGFDQYGRIQTGLLAKVPKYDQTRLVLPSIGCPWYQRTFEERMTAIQSIDFYAGYDDWVRIDSIITTNGPEHTYERFHLGYLQYGWPYLSADDVRSPYEVREFFGRAYVRYFENWQATIVLFVMTPCYDLLIECDESILSQTVISDARSFSLP